MQLEGGIPMITSQKEDDYTIASVPLAGMEVVRRLKWPGPFGLGHRYFYLVRKQITVNVGTPGNPPAVPPVNQGKN